MQLILLGLLGLMHTATAANYFWAGTNTDFANITNWSGGITPSASNPAATDLTGVYQAFTSYVAPGTYNVGSILKLPRNGQLIFAATPSTTTVLSFNSNANPNAPGAVTATFSVSTTDQSNDFSCHLNWRVGSASGSVAQATQVPCVNDEAIFLDTVSIWDSLGSVTVAGVSAIGGNFTSAAQLPIFQFANIINDTYLGSAAMANCPLVTTTGSCYCFTSCGNTQQNIYQDTIEMQAEQQEAADQEATWNSPIQKSFTITFDVQAMTGLTSNYFPGQFLSNSNNHADFLTQVANGFASQMGATPTGLSVAISATVVTVTGSITASTLNFTSPPGTPLATNGGSITVAIEPTGNAPSPVNSFTQTAWIVTPAAYVNAVVDSLVAQISASCAPQTSCSGLVAPISAIARIFKTPASALNTICATGASFCLSQASIATALSAIPSNEWSRYGLDLNTTALNSYIGSGGSIPTAMSNAGMTSAVNSAFFSAVNTILGNIGQINSGFLSANPPYPQTVSFSFNAGYNLPPNILQMDVNYNNQVNLQNQISTSMTGLSGVQRVLSVSVSLDTTTPEDRRRGTAASPTSILVAVQYIAYCPNNNAASCSSPSSSLQTMIEEVVETTLNGYTIVTDPCENITAYPSWNLTCYIKELQSDINNDRSVYTPTYVTNLVTTTLSCDYRGQKPTGGCYAPSPTATTDISTVLSSLSYPTSSAASTSNSSSTAIGVGVGVGFGVLVLVVLILIVVVRRRGSHRGPNPKSDDRTVVAFENPMYDDPAQKEVNVMYDSGASQYAGVEAHDGLYDEPAYNQTTSVDKSNPLYQSQENIAAQQVEESGYLDVAANEETAGPGGEEAAPDDARGFDE